MSRAFSQGRRRGDDNEEKADDEDDGMTVMTTTMGRRQRQWDEDDDVHEWIYPLSSREAYARARPAPRTSRLVCARDSRFVALFSPRERAHDTARRGTAREAGLSKWDRCEVKMRNEIADRKNAK